MEASLILNTLVLLRDGSPGYQFDLTGLRIVGARKRRGNVTRRLEYLR